MANVVMTNPIGLAERVQRLQTDLYGHLKRVWGVTDATYNAYGLCYKNKKGNGYVPEAYIGGNGGKDYDLLGHNDKVSVTSFFAKGDSSKVSERKYETEVSLIMFVNLSRLTGISALTHRGDHEARLEVYNYVRQCLYGFDITGEVTGIENVLKEYTGISKSANIWKVGDSGQNHAFRFNMRCVYNLTDRI